MLKALRAFAFAATLAIPAAAFAAGAIAIDDTEGMDHDETGFGTATGEASSDEAASAAMQRCRSTGNENCRVVLRFSKCGAYAVSRDHFGTGTGRTLRAAERDALDGCGARCRIVVSECDD